jgi:4-hydroxy-tetrahydrodipicolinate synthase
MKTIQGSIPAILTPMQDDGALDLPGLRRLLDWHIAEGTDGVVIVGTTGESPTVDYEEHCALIETAVKHVAGRIPVIAGTGANSTPRPSNWRSLPSSGCRCPPVGGALLQQADAGRPVPHFKAIAEAVELPMILYNVPGTHRCRPGERHDAATGADTGHRRHQGCDGEYRARFRPVEARSGRLQRVQRR